MKKRFSEEQVIGFLRKANGGLAFKELWRRHGYSEASYCLWCSKFGGINVSLTGSLNGIRPFTSKSTSARDEEILMRQQFSSLAKFTEIDSEVLAWVFINARFLHFAIPNP